MKPNVKKRKIILKKRKMGRNPAICGENLEKLSEEGIFAGKINEAYEKVVSSFDMFVLCRMRGTW